MDRVETAGSERPERRGVYLVFLLAIAQDNVRRRWTDADNGSMQATVASPNTYTKHTRDADSDVHMFAYRRGTAYTGPSEGRTPAGSWQRGPIYGLLAT